MNWLQVKVYSSFIPISVLIIVTLIAYDTSALESDIYLKVFIEMVMLFSAPCDFNHYNY